MKNHYKFCSICGQPLYFKNGNLHCSRCPFVNYRNPRPTTTAIILYGEKILLTKRSNTPFKGWWDLPGGFLNKDETPPKALKRELKEELGLLIRKQKLFGLYTGTYPSKFDPFYILSVVYIVEPKSSSVRILDKKELSDARWFSRNKLPKKIAFDSNQRILRDFINSKKLSRYGRNKNEYRRS